MLKSLLVEKSFSALDVLLSEKFLAAVVSLLVVFNVLPDNSEGQVLEAVLTVITAVGYIISAAIVERG